jgi:hypothetical protein
VQACSRRVVVQHLLVGDAGQRPRRRWTTRGLNGDHSGAWSGKQRPHRRAIEVDREGDDLTTASSAQLATEQQHGWSMSSGATARSGERAVRWRQANGGSGSFLTGAPRTTPVETRVLILCTAMGGGRMGIGPRHGGQVGRQCRQVGPGARRASLIGGPNVAGFPDLKINLKSAFHRGIID